LRLLTPGGWNADASTVPTHGTLVAAGHLLAEEAARIAAESPQWMAEAVALSPEEAAISLEAEMFGTFSAKPATAAGDAMEAAGIPGVSAMAAAVENTLAKAALAAGANILPEPGPEPSEEPVCGTTLRRRRLWRRKNIGMRVGMARAKNPQTKTRSRKRITRT